MARTWLAHSENPKKVPETYRQHAIRVARLARKFAAKFGMRREGQLAGLLHDVGKMSTIFQDRLKGKIIEKVDHSSPGAWYALTELHEVQVGLAMAGHHIGIPGMSRDTLRSSIDPVLLANDANVIVKPTITDMNVVRNELAAEGLRFTKNPTVKLPSDKDHIAYMLDTRMLYSSLVDADWLATERHFKMAPRAKPAKLDAARAIKHLVRKVNARRAELVGEDITSNKVLDMRSQLLDDCVSQAQLAPGVFTLTAPTGSGKTLSMLRFAFEHAKHYPHFERIIVAMPYLTIIEQTYDVYSEFKLTDVMDILQDNSIVRGGGVYESEKERAAKYVENWSAPLILTTNVQMLESLFSNRIRACRKLHNICNSIILFDEVQSLKLALTVPTLQALSHLAQKYNCTIVFSTATQPAFDSLNSCVALESSESGALSWVPREIVRDVPKMFASAKRHVLDLSLWSTPTSWDVIANMMSKDRQSLCIVNLKRHALALVQKLQAKGVKNLYHISTNMCVAHRRNVLKCIRRHLEDGEEVTVVSTQCIEAGVDIDFPVVYRAFAPLDSLAQAAGRCNRRGHLPVDQARFIVFLPEVDGRSIYPSDSYHDAANVLKRLLLKRGTDWLAFERQECFSEYYKTLYAMHDMEHFSGEFYKALNSRHFPDVSKYYFLIDQDAVNVLVPYEKQSFNDRLQEAEKHGISREWVKSVRDFSVNCFRNRDGSSKAMRYLTPIKFKGESEPSSEWFYVDPKSAYYDSGLLGLSFPDEKEARCGDDEK